MPLDIQSLNHVSFQTMRLEESRRFYIDVLGAKEISRPNFDFVDRYL